MSGTPMTPEIVQYLEGRVRKSIVTDVQNVARFQSKTPTGSRGGFFSTPRLVFCYVDFLGHLAFGGGSTEAAERFLNTFFPANYHPYAELTYSMFRHGTVHEFVPKTLYCDLSGSRPKRIRLRWMINNEDTPGHRSANMKFYRMTRKKASLHLNLNICQLGDDLLLALDAFVAKLKSDGALLRSCQRRLKVLLEIKDANLRASIQRDASRKAVVGQIQTAWANRSGLIDEKGQTLKGR